MPSWICGKSLERRDRSKPFASEGCAGHSRQFGGVVLAVAIMIVLQAHVGRAAEQQPALPVNPRAVEFDDPETELEVSSYRVELFHSRADTRSAQAVSVLDVMKSVVSQNQGRVRIEIGQLFDNVPDGVYIVTLQVVGPGSLSDRSEPAGPFQVSGHFNGDPFASAGGAGSPSPGPDDPGLDHERGGRFWSIVGIAMGIATFIVSFIK
jgi:hypothetical protein